MVAALLDFPVVMPQELDREKMRARRKELKLSQGEAAAAAGFGGGTSAWSDIETGRKANVTMETLARIAAALECDARDLITDPPAKPSRGRL